MLVITSTLFNHLSHCCEYIIIYNYSHFCGQVESTTYTVGCKLSMHVRMNILIYTACNECFLSVNCAHLVCLFFAEGALLVNGTDCTGHVTVVNATVQQVECSPAVNTVQLPVVEAAWELEVADVSTTGCYKVVLFQNQSVAYYETFQKTVDQKISIKLLVNTSTSVTECDNNFKAAMNTTRSSICCLNEFHHFLAVDKDRGSLILQFPDQVNTAEDLLHGKPATCSLTGSDGRTVNSSFPIIMQNSEPNHIHGRHMHDCLLFWHESY